MTIRKIHLKVSWLVSLLGLFLLTGCSYSNYLHMNYQVHHSPVWNQDSTTLAFVLSTRAWLPAKGLSRFPDGGMPKNLYKEVALYSYDTIHKQLSKISTFPGLTELLGSHRSNWSSRLYFHNNRLYYQIAPLMDWQWYIKHANTEEEKREIENLETKYAQPFYYDQGTQSIEKSDTSTFQSIYVKPSKSPWHATKVALMKMPLSSIGLDVQTIYPKSDDAYIEETLLLQNPSPVTRRAVAEQIMTKQSKELIHSYISRIDKQIADLEGTEKLNYERRIEPIYQLLQGML